MSLDLAVEIIAKRLLDTSKRQTEDAQALIEALRTVPADMWTCPTCSRTMPDWKRWEHARVGCRP